MELWHSSLRITRNHNSYGNTDFKDFIGQWLRNMDSSRRNFTSTFTEAQTNDLGDIGGKPRREGERTLTSNLYLCLGHEEQRALHNQHPHLDMETIRYPRFLDTCVALFQKERNETYEMYQMLSRKPKKG